MYAYASKITAIQAKLTDVWNAPAYAQYFTNTPPGNIPSTIDQTALDAWNDIQTKLTTLNSALSSGISAQLDTTNYSIVMGTAVGMDHFFTGSIVNSWIDGIAVAEEGAFLDWVLTQFNLTLAGSGLTFLNAQLALVQTYLTTKTAQVNGMFGQMSLYVSTMQEYFSRTSLVGMPFGDITKALAIHALSLRSAANTANSDIAYSLNAINDTRADSESGSSGVWATNATNQVISTSGYVATFGGINTNLAASVSALTYTGS